MAFSKGKIAKLSPAMGALKGLGLPSVKKFKPKQAANKASAFTKMFKGQQ